MKFLWIFDQDGIYTLPLLTAALWALGGSGILSVRRFLLPALIFATLYSQGFERWLSALVATLLFVSSTLPYGLKSKAKLNELYYPFLILIGAAYGASLFPLAIAQGYWPVFGIIPLAMGAWVSGLFYFSQSADFPKHKICEILIGGLFGIFILIMLLKPIFQTF